MTTTTTTNTSASVPPWLAQLATALDVPVPASADAIALLHGQRLSPRPAGEAVMAISEACVFVSALERITASNPTRAGEAVKAMLDNVWTGVLIATDYPFDAVNGAKGARNA